MACYIKYINCIECNCLSIVIHLQLINNDELNILQQFLIYIAHNPFKFLFSKKEILFGVRNEVISREKEKQNISKFLFYITFLKNIILQIVFNYKTKIELSFKDNKDNRKILRREK